MTTVSISELKANLSRYVREVRRGGEVQVLDRGAPVARLVPTSRRGQPGSPGPADQTRPAEAGQGRRRRYSERASAGAPGEPFRCVGRGSGRPAVRYWDSSALVPLVVVEPASSLARAWLADDERIITWVWTRIEIVSAIERRTREGSLSRRQRREAREPFRRLRWQLGRGD